MKILIIVIAFINGGYMLLDGIFVMLKGKYIGPEKPGPWAGLFNRLNIDVFKLGPLFIIFGLLWLIWIYGVWANQSWAYVSGLLIAVLTLWYLPLGTLLSVAVLVMLVAAKTKLGF